MDINDQMLSKFKNFINDLIKVFPEHSETIQTNYNDILELDKLIIDDNEIINEFLEKISDISDNIMDKNDEIFTDDLFLIKDVSMKSIWTTDISNKTKDSIWEYLNVFCLINLNLTSGKMMEQTQKKLSSGEKITKKELSVMKNVKKLNENINNDNSTDDDNSMNILENTSIGNLAKEITNSLDLNEDNATDMLKPENMMNIFQSINSTLQDKVNNKEIDMNELFGEASGLMNNGMMDNMMGMFGNMMGPSTTGSDRGMPDISSMMGMMQQMQGQMPQPDPTPQEPVPNKSQNKGNHDPEVVKERLRKKLESKK